MRIPHEWVATALGAYYMGRSLNSIPEVMYQLCGDFVTKVSIDKWVTRFSKLAIAEANKTKVTVGSTWLASENAIKIRGKSYWVIDIIDLETKFLLATGLSRGRGNNGNDIESILEAAKNKAGKVPQRVFCNDWKGYVEGIRLVYGANVAYIQDASPNSKSTFNRLIEYWHNTLRARNKVLSRLKSDANAQLVLDGWLVHYNYFSIQDALNGRTPSEVARSDFRYHTWADLICQSNIESGAKEMPAKQNTVRSTAQLSPYSYKLIKEFLMSNSLDFSKSYDSHEILPTVRKPKSNRIFRVIANL